MAATQLRSISNSPPRRTAERIALAEGIERHSAARRQLARLKAALDSTDNLLYGESGASRASDRAEAALKEAKADESRHLAAVALNEATGDANPVTAAERAVTEAQSRLNNAYKTRDALKEQAKAAENDLQYATRDLDRCIRAVLREEAGAILDDMLRETIAMQEQLGAKRVLLSFLGSECFEANAEQRRPIADFLAEPVFPWVWNNKSHEHPVLAPWHQAREALRQNADAPLPA